MSKETALEELHRLVEQLESSERGQVVELLQKMGAMLLNRFEIQLGDTIIEPLLVEAYYHHPEKFPDDSVHAAKDSDANTYTLARKRQAGHFGELYIHFGTKDGLDITLSRQNGYYLSFLIKNALVNGEWATQCGITEKLCGVCSHASTCEKGINCIYYGKIVLKPVEYRGHTVVFSGRKGIENDCASNNLAALPMDQIRNYKLTCTPSRTRIICAYIEKRLSQHPGEADRAQLKELASGLIDWKQFEG